MTALLKEAMTDVGIAAIKEEPKRVYERKVDKLGRSYGTGKCKESIARVWIKPGSGKATVNGKDITVYFASPLYRMVIAQPFGVIDRMNQYDILCTITGGGLSGQAKALRHGISKALVLQDPKFRDGLKKAGFITRDSRRVERKKYGKHKARRSTQFCKR